MHLVEASMVSSFHGLHQFSLGFGTFLPKVRTNEKLPRDQRVRKSHRLEPPVTIGSKQNSCWPVGVGGTSPGQFRVGLLLGDTAVEQWPMGVA